MRFSLPSLYNSHYSLSDRLKFYNIGGGFVNRRPPCQICYLLDNR